MSLNNMPPQKKKFLFFGFIGFILIVVISSIIVISTSDKDELGGGASYDDDRQFDQEADDYWRKHEFISYLPIVESDYRVDYGECETSNEEFCLMISADTQEARDKAVQSLKDIYLNLPNEYPIEYFALEK